jgi:hypothetical protein
MPSTSYHAGPPDEKVPFLASVFNAAGFVFLIAILPVGLAPSHDYASVKSVIAGAICCLLTALFCFGFARVIVLLTKIELNTRTEDTLHQEVKLLKEIAQHTETKTEAAPKTHS